MNYLFKTAEDLFLNQKFQEAIILFDRLIRENPDFDKVYFYLSKCYFELEDFANALINICCAISISPSNLSYFLLRSKIYSEFYSDYYTAFKDLEYIISFDNNHILAIIEMGMQYLNNFKDYSIAAKYFSKGIDLTSDEDHLLTLFTNRGFAYTLLGNYDLANDDFLIAESLNKFSPLLHYHKAFYHKKLSQNDLAINEYKLVTEIYPLHTGVLKELCELLMKECKYDECLYFINMGLSIKPQYFFFLCLKAQLYYELNSFSDLDEILNIIESYETKNNQELYHKAKLYLDISEIDMAIKLFKSAHYSQNSDGYSEYMIGYCYFQTNNYENAKKFFKYSNQINNCENFDLFLKLGICCCQTSCTEDAKYWLNRAKNIDPNNEVVKEWLKECEIEFFNPFE